MLMRKTGLVKSGSNPESQIAINWDNRTKDDPLRQLHVAV